jgi:preprotein translocase subunit SecE
MKGLKDEKEIKEGKESKIGAVAGETIGAVGSWPKRTRAFLEEVRAETRRVTWPSFRQVQATTIVVIITVAFFGAYLGLLDVIYTRAISWILRLGQ